MNKNNLEDKWHVVDRSSGDYGDAYIEYNPVLNGTSFVYDGPSFTLYGSAEFQLLERLIHKKFNGNPLACLISDLAQEKSPEIHQWLKDKLDESDFIHPNKSIRNLTKYLTDIDF